jgi:hypothetical protein
MLTKIVTRGASGLLIIAAMAMFAAGVEAEKAPPRPAPAEQAANTEVETFPPGTVALF